MPHLPIDPKRCTRDGLCIDECPLNLVSANPVTGFPEIKPGKESLCVACGHCVAVCPHDALDNIAIPKALCPPILTERIIGKKEAIQFLRSRRSARVFKPKPVDTKTIAELIEIGGYAPSASNARPVEWIVFTDRDQIARLTALTIDWMAGLVEQGPQAVYSAYIVPIIQAWAKGEDHLLRNTPALVFAIAPGSARYGMVDLTIALTYVELIAPKFGLAACWAGILHRAMQYNPSLREHVGIGETHPHFYPMMVGYPKYSYHRLLYRKPPMIQWK